jgi:hypothetical protein
MKTLPYHSDGLLSACAAIFGAMALTSWLLTLVEIAVLAAPFAWLWNYAIVPMSRLPSISYGRALGMLLLWYIVRLAGAGVSLSTKLRDPS